MYKIDDCSEVKDNFFLYGRGVGACGALVGDVSMMTIVLKSSPEDWPDMARFMYFAEVVKAVNFIKKEAARYGVSLNLREFRFETEVSADANPKDGFSLVKDFFLKDTVEEVQAYYKQTMHLNEVPIILALNKKGRSFAKKENTKRKRRTQEISIVFFYKRRNYSNVWRTIAHELLHQFGAVDYYFPKEVKALARKYIVDSIMGVGEPVVDDLTAYLIGWKDTVSENTYEFLKQTMWINAENYSAALKQEWKR